MRKSKTKKISEIFIDFFKSIKSDHNYIDPLQLWKEVLGGQIISETREVYLEKNILYIDIKNPYLKTDLKSRKGDILKKIQILEPTIKDLLFK